MDGGNYRHLLKSRNVRPGWLISFVPGFRRLNVCRVKAVEAEKVWPTKCGGMAACGWSLTDTLEALNKARGLDG